MKGDQDQEQVTEAWKLHRAYLVDLAFRMLGDIGEAEDIVQEAFTRFLRADLDGIEDARGWLIVVTSRMCLDHIGSARSRRQRPYDMGPSQSGLLETSAGTVDPADRVTLDDNVKLALLVVLERLSPAERVVYVLHDVFQLPFDTVATTIGRPVPTCRQLARRARQKIEAPDGTHRFDVPTPEHLLVTQKFMAACANGDFEGLLAVLDPDASGTIDTRSRVVVTGAPQVARNLLRYWGEHGTMVSQSLGSQSFVLAFDERQLIMVFVLTIEDGHISKIHGIADPVKVGFLEGQLGLHL